MMRMNCAGRKKKKFIFELRKKRIFAHTGVSVIRKLEQWTRNFSLFLWILFSRHTRNEENKRTGLWTDSARRENGESYSRLGGESERNPDESAELPIQWKYIHHSNRMGSFWTLRTQLSICVYLTKSFKIFFITYPLLRILPFLSLSGLATHLA